MFKLVEFDNNSFRSNMFSEQDICKWISIHSKHTNTSWCVNNKLSNSESSRFVCRYEVNRNIYSYQQYL